MNAEEPKMCGRCYQIVDELYAPTCLEKPEEWVGMPLGQYHCPDCGAMLVAGLSHPDLCKKCLNRVHPAFDKALWRLLLKLKKFY